MTYQRQISRYCSTLDLVSGQEGEHEEAVDPLLSEWLHLREIVTELPDSVTTNETVKLSNCEDGRRPARTDLDGLGRTQCGRWRS